MWKSSYKLWLNSSFWLLLRDRLNTINILKRKNKHLDDETLFHLFFQCQFSQVCWNSLGIMWNLPVDPMDMISEAQHHFNHFNSKAFRDVLITTCWSIWCHKNSASTSLVRWKAHFRVEFSIVSLVQNRL